MKQKKEFELEKWAERFCFAAGGVCLLYFLLLAVFVGLSSKFNYAWLVMGIFFLLYGLFIKKRKKALPKAVRGVILFFILIGTVIFLNVEGLIISGFFESGEENLDYIIVLGAQMKESGPSNILQSRLDKAIEYLERNPETKVVVSGGQGSDEPMSEAEGMKRYLVQKGIAPERIFMEDRSVNTKQNLKFSSEYINIEEETVGIVTSNFHIYRSVRLARKQGYANVCGIAAKSKTELLPANMLREFCSVVYYAVTGSI